MATTPGFSYVHAEESAVHHLLHLQLPDSADLFELAGTSATLGGHALDRYWRNVRTHTLHDPVRWKYHAIGNYVLNGKLPPRHGAI